MWILIILAVHVNDPQDVPGRVTLEFPTQQACEQARESMTYWLKFKSFRVEARCEKQSSS